MAKKKKSKKGKKPNIPAQTLARPRLEQILARYLQGELDEVEYVESIKALMADLGQDKIMNVMVGLLDGATNEQRDALMVAIPKVGDAATIEHLWNLVERSKMSIAGKMTAMVILKQMGEEVDLENPGKYFSWRDIKQADLDQVEDLARYGTQALVKEVQQADNPDELEGLMVHLEDLVEQSGGEEVQLEQIETLIEMGGPDAADMLAAISLTTRHTAIRDAARAGLEKLAEQNIYPQSPAVKALQGEHFYAAYSTDPANPWQQSVMVFWERGKDDLQGLAFLLDFGAPWKGGIKDFYPTGSMTPQQVQRQFIKRANEAGVEFRQITYDRARRIVLGAMETNEQNRVRFPPEFHHFRHLVERRLINPSPETLAYAEKVDAGTEDEWGELAGEPLRGLGLVGPDGEAMPLIMPDDVTEEFEEIADFDELLAAIEEYYEEKEETQGDEGPLPQDWVADYLTTRFNEEVELTELDERWRDLWDFMAYLDEDDQAPETLADLQGAHLSRFVTEFWDEEFGEDTPESEKRHVVETIRDLYSHLAAQGQLNQEVAAGVAEAAETILSQPDQSTPVE